MPELWAVTRWGGFKTLAGADRCRAPSVRSRLAKRFEPRTPTTSVNTWPQESSCVPEQSSYRASRAPTPSVRSYLDSSSLLRASALSFSFPPSSSYSKQACPPPPARPHAAVPLLSRSPPLLVLSTSPSPVPPPLHNSVILLDTTATWQIRATNANWSTCALECQSYANL